MTKQRSSSSSSSNKADLTTLFRLPTTDIADRLNAMFDTECKPHYKCRDYLHDAEDDGEEDDLPPRRKESQYSCSTTTTTVASSSRYSSRRSSRSRSRSTRRSSSRQRSDNINNKTIVTPASRTKIVQWLNDCVDYLELPRECVAVAMSYVDRFMSSSTNNSNKSSSSSNKHKSLVAQAKQDATIYQLLAISSLFLSTKQLTDKLSLIDADILARVSHGSYSSQEIVDMEVQLLEALEWRLCGPSALCEAHHVIALLAKISTTSNKRRIASVVDFTRLQIELAVGDYATSVLRTPSEVALAAVLNSMDLLEFTPKEKRALDRALLEWTGMDVRTQSVEEAREELHEVFDRQSSDVFSRATLSSQTVSVETGSSSKNKREQSFHSTKSPVCVADDDEFDRPVRRSKSRTNRRASRQSRRIPLEP